MKNSRIYNGIIEYYLVFAVIIIFLALLFRSSGIYYGVTADEYYYSKFSRLLPLAEAAVPSYIYLAIYRITNICGDGFLNGARILNALFFVAATPFIYLTARRACTRGVASIVALLALLGPINSYTVYYMPEALYFFSFWFLTWFILDLDNASDLRSWCFTGIILGLASLVKPHALFLLPAIVAYILYVSRKKDSGWALQAISKTGIFVACTFFTKFLISYLIAGKAGVTIFGPMYTSMASSTTSNYQRYIELLTLSGKSVKGHVLAICLMFGMPIAFAIYASFNSVVSKVRIKIGQKISFYTLAVLFSLVLFTSFFTALVANTNPYETAARLHMRYYNFALPLLFVVAASQLSLDSITGKFRWRLTIALPIGAAILYAVSTRMVPYTPNLVDNPELRGFMFNSTVFYILSGLSFLALALWVYAARAGAKIFIYFFMPLAIAFSTFYVNQELRPRLAPNVYVKAGIFTKQYLSNNDLSKVVIVGSEPLGLYRSVSLFYMDNPEASLETIPRGSAYNLSRLPAGKEWVLIIGDHSLSENTFFQLPMNGFTLVRASGNNTVRFKKSAWPGILSRTSGLFPAEAWGTWSSSKFVTLEFSMPLPEKFTVHLVAHAYGPNVGKEFLAHVGDNSIGFKLSASPEERKLKFSNPKRLRTIIIDIPLAVSPKELGLGDDDRSLGIALTELRIVPL